MADKRRPSDRDHENQSKGRKRRTGARLVALRRCEVCEWQGEVIESAGANPDCPWCHGPTVRQAVLTGDADPAPDERGGPPAADKNPHAAALGRLGGLKGGRARADALTPAQRRRIASRAARARWDKKKDP